MARTPLFRDLARAARLALLSLNAEDSEADPRADAAKDAAKGPTRRDALRTIGAGAAAGMLPLSFGGCSAESDSGLQIAIVGAGAAGLHCAYRLQQAGVFATVYEASSRVGGRALTARGLFPDGLFAELGGEFLDSEHTATFALATELGLTIDDVSMDGPNLNETTFMVDGEKLEEDAVVAEFRPLAAAMARAVALAEADDDAFAALDAQSILAWLDAEPAASEVIKKLINAAYLSEYGLETDEQSVFNLLYLIDYDEAEPLRIYGGSGDRYRIAGGTDGLTTALAERLDGQITMGYRLVALARSGDGYALDFDSGSGRKRTYADHVVLALPFTMLRDVDIDADFSDAKNRVIAELGYATNAKLMLGFDGRPWRESPLRSSGAAITNSALQRTWESSRGQRAASSIFTNYVGGVAGIAMGAGTPEERAEAALPLIEDVFPGITDSYRPMSAVRMNWPAHPFTRGSYSCYRPGQWSFFGLEGERAGNVHFAGEHCSQDYRGRIEGAVETGAFAAREILADVGLVTGAIESLLGTRTLVPGAYVARGGTRLRKQQRRRWLREVGR
jgi:monoamine oxidase